MSTPGPLLSVDQFDELGDGDKVKAMRLDSVIQDIRDLCGWHIAPSITETLTLDGPGRRTLLLPSLYVTAITAVTEDGTAVPADQFDWSEKGMLRHRSGLWTDRWRGITVTLTHGYDQAPAGVIGVIADVVADAMAVPLGTVPEKMGPFEFGGGGTAFKSHQLAVLYRYQATSSGPASSGSL
ncbi:hypothetical protein [Nocardia salmonicida]|uniref:hypothetical protein n=1 Tax=Nocardia salmonicida TaxID=53431 RepID=UPI002E2C97A0|nr:hypothetical protein [Nocardia salmonicida]